MNRIAVFPMLTVGTLALAASMAHAQPPEYDRVPGQDVSRAAGGSTDATVGQLWSQYDSVNSPLAGFGPSSRVVYGQLPGSTAPANTPFPKPNDRNRYPAMNPAEIQLYNQGFNVLKLRELMTRELNKQLDEVREFRDFLTTATGSRTPSALTKARNQFGLVAIPDQEVRDAAASWYQASLRPGFDGRVSNSRQGEVLARFFQANQEAWRIRDQVLKKNPADNLSRVASDAGKTRYDMITLASNAVDRVRNIPASTPQDAALRILRDTNDKLDQLGRVMGLERSPTTDEAIGLRCWLNYFEGREKPQGNGERDVARYLDTREVQLAADMLRFDASILPPNLLDRSERVDNLTRFDPKELPGAPPHEWRSVAKSTQVDYRMNPDRFDHPERVNGNDRNDRSPSRPAKPAK